MQGINRGRSGRRLAEGFAVAFLVFTIAPALAWPQTQSQADRDKAQESPSRENTPSSYDQITPVLLGKENLHAVMARDKADKGSVMARQQKLLEERYNLASRPDGTVRMSRGKPIQVGPTARLARGIDLGASGRDALRRDSRKGPVAPRAFCPCRTPSTKWEAWSSRRWRSSSSPVCSASTSISTCPSTSSPSFRRPST